MAGTASLGLADRQRAFALVLALFALVLQQLTPLCLTQPNTPHGHTIVLCTAAGLKTIFVDDDKAPAGPEQQHKSPTCTLCASHSNTLAFTAPEANSIEVAAAFVSTRHVNSVRPPERYFELYASRAPPHLAA